MQEKESLGRYIFPWFGGVFYTSGQLLKLEQHLQLWGASKSELI